MPSVSSAFFQAFSCAFKARLPLLAAALWWGSGMGLGFVAAPLLIRHAASVPQAAAFTLEIFQAQTWLALACGVALLLRARVRRSRLMRLWWGLPPWACCWRCWCSTPPPRALPPASRCGTQPVRFCMRASACARVCCCGAWRGSQAVDAGPFAPPFCFAFGSK